MEKKLLIMYKLEAESRKEIWCRRKEAQKETKALSLIALFITLKVRKGFLIA
jgi:hypothetical protein